MTADTRFADESQRARFWRRDLCWIHGLVVFRLIDIHLGCDGRRGENEPISKDRPYLDVWWFFDAHLLSLCTKTVLRKRPEQGLRTGDNAPAQSGSPLGADPSQGCPTPAGAVRLRSTSGRYFGR